MTTQCRPASNKMFRPWPKRLKMECGSLENLRIKDWDLWMKTHTSWNFGAGDGYGAPNSVIHHWMEGIIDIG